MTTDEQVGWRGQGRCVRCDVEGDVAAWRQHGERVLCEPCASQRRPSTPPIVAVDVSRAAATAVDWFCDCEPPIRDIDAWCCAQCGGRIARARRSEAVSVTECTIVDDEPRRLPDLITRVVNRLEVHGLPVEYGGPGLVGSSCPLCPPEPVGVVPTLMRVQMVVEFTPAGVYYHCRKGCDPEQINTVLAGSPKEVAA